MFGVDREDDVSDKQAAAFWDALEDAIKPVMARQSAQVLRWASDHASPQTWFQNLAWDALQGKKKRKKRRR